MTQAALPQTRQNLLLMLLLPACGCLAAVEQPYGHPDFYPSADRPAQLRGDGSSSFPGATPVDSFDFRTGENIVWACRLPGWGFSSPIVVGDKVFVTCDWNKLICVDARSGSMLWAHDNHTYDQAGEDQSQSLQETFRTLTEPWLGAWAMIFERAYLERQLDLIACARAGTDLKPRQAMRKGKMRDRSNWGGTCPGDVLTKSEIASLLEKAKAVDDQEVQKLQQRYDALSAEIKSKDIGPQTSGYVPCLSPYRRGSEAGTAYKKQSSAHFSTLQKHGIIFEIWNGWMGRSFSTPASDGQYVYAQFGQSQVVCYDLAGVRRWIKVFPEGAVKSIRQNDSASPLIAGDTLLVLMGGREGETWLRALDTATGEQRWVQHLRYERSSHSFPNQTLARIDGIDVVATSAGSILRVDTGEVIMDNLPAPIAAPLVIDKEVYLTCGYGQSNGQGSRMKITLSKEGDTITGRVDWAFLYKKSPWWAAASASTPGFTPQELSGKPPCANITPVLLDGKLMNGVAYYDAQTGKLIPNLKTNRPRGVRKGAPSGNLIHAGDKVIGVAGGLPVYIYDAVDPAAELTIGHLGSQWHRQLQLGQLQLDDVVKQVVTVPWLPSTASHLGGQTTPWPQGDRLYIRTMDSLYCIGDPQKAYHSPADTPAEARTK